MILDLILGIFCVGLLFCSAFFSSSETALFALDARQRHTLAKRQDLPARRVATLLGDLGQVLVTLLIGNTFVNILLAVLATRIFLRQIGPERGPLISGLVVTGLLLVFGEILPKSIAVRRPQRHSLRIAGPLLRVERALARPSAGFRALNRKVLSILERLAPGDDLEMSEDELLALVSLGEEEGGIAARERQFVEGAFALGETTVQELMTPRVDLFLLAADRPAGEAAREMRRMSRSHAPVYGESPDEVLGILSAADLLGARDPEQPVIELCQPAHFCPESQRASSLLFELLAEGLPLAVVLDEYGALAGLATLDDLYQPLVGEALSEEDFESRRFYLPDENTLIASSRLPLERVGELLGEELRSDEVETLGGYLMEQLGELPELGRRYRLGDLHWTLLSGDGPALGTLRLERRS